MKPKYFLIISLGISLLSLKSYSQTDSNNVYKIFGADTTQLDTNKNVSKMYSLLPKSTNNRYRTIKIFQKLNVVNEVRLNVQTADVDTVKTPLLPGTFYSFRSVKPQISASVITIPFKVRPKKDTVSTSVETGFANGGILLGKTISTTRYFFDETQSSYNFTFGVFIAPAAIKFKDREGAELTQLAISTGFGIAYSFNAMNLFLALGFDIGTAPEIRKDWIYNNQMWVGFGLGIDTSFINLGKK